jgi:hypothetical protein
MNLLDSVKSVFYQWSYQKAFNYSESEGVSTLAAGVLLLSGIISSQQHLVRVLISQSRQPAADCSIILVGYSVEAVVPAVC